MRYHKHERCCSFAGMTAADLRIGQDACISSLGRGRGFRAKMLGMGVRPGASMKIVGGSHRGPMIIEVGRQKVMLGSEMLAAIFIDGEEK